jgi:hypothetical protein
MALRRWRATMAALTPPPWLSIFGRFLSSLGQTNGKIVKEAALNHGSKAARRDFGH